MRDFKPKRYADWADVRKAAYASGEAPESGDLIHAPYIGYARVCDWVHAHDDYVCGENKNHYELMGHCLDETGRAGIFKDYDGTVDARWPWTLRAIYSLHYATLLSRQGWRANMRWFGIRARFELERPFRLLWRLTVGRWKAKRFVAAYRASLGAGTPHARNGA